MMVIPISRDKGGSALFTLVLFFGSWLVRQHWHFPHVSSFKSTFLSLFHPSSLRCSESLKEVSMTGAHILQKIFILKASCIGIHTLVLAIILKFIKFTCIKFMLHLDPNWIEFYELMHSNTDLQIVADIMNIAKYVMNIIGVLSRILDVK